MDYRIGHQQFWLTEISDVIDVKLIAKPYVMQIISNSEVRIVELLSVALQRKLKYIA